MRSSEPTTSYFEIGLDFNDHGQWYLDQPTDNAGGKLVTGTFWRGDIWHGRTPLRTSIRQKGHPVSFSHSGHSEYLVSKSLMDVLRRALPPEQLEGIPIEFEGAPEPYEVLNVLDIVDCVDETRSEFTKWTSEDGLPHRVGDYRMSFLRIDERKAAGHELFRVKGWLIALICSERIRDLLIANGVTGIRFTPVN